MKKYWQVHPDWPKRQEPTSNSSIIRIMHISAWRYIHNIQSHDSDDVSLNSCGLPRTFDSPEASKKHPTNTNNRWIHGPSSNVWVFWGFQV